MNKARRKRSPLYGKILAAFAKRFNNQISSVEVMLSWFYGLALGAERFEHFTRYRRDRLLGELLGIKRFCSPDTLRRLFLRFHYREVTEASERLMALLEFRALDSHCLWQA